jgi:methionine-rich copper-binding protein CopC
MTMASKIFGPVVLALACAVATSAVAHARMLSGSPAPGSAVAGSPGAISIDFNEPVFPKFSGVILKDAAGHAAPTGPTSVDAADKSKMSVTVKGRLAPGAYTVEWHAVSSDTHRTQGSYAFTVK